MLSRKFLLAVLVMILVQFLIGFYFYPQMPEQMASHWNINGEVDGYMPKVWGLFLLPLVSLGLFFLFALIPKIDPLRENIKKFMGYYEGFIALMIGFMFYIYLLTIFWNIGFVFNMNLRVIPAIGILFFYIGDLLEHSKRNWFVGIRTPWTLSSEKVWENTHRLGGKLFKISGLIAVIGILFGNLAFWFVIIPIISFSVYLVAYSYFEYQKLNKKKTK